MVAPSLVPSRQPARAGGDWWTGSERVTRSFFLFSRFLHSTSFHSLPHMWYDRSMSPRAGSTYDQGRHVRISKEVGGLMDRLREKMGWTVKEAVERAVKKLAAEEGVE